MFFYILNTVAPVFVVICIGYLCVYRGVFTTGMVDGLMKFAVQIAIPCLLFLATASINLAEAYLWQPMLAFYTGAVCSFSASAFIVWRFFGRRPGEAIAVGFAGLFSNLVLLGLPIVERSLGQSAMPLAFAVVSLHAPICYFIGITSMEFFRADGRSGLETMRVVVTTMFKNSIMIGIGLGFIVNLSEIQLPELVFSTLEILAKAALPIALFGLGGVLARYPVKSELKEATSILLLSLIGHPLLVYILCALLGVGGEVRNTVVLMAAMAPGLNAFLFANMYSRGQGTAASTVVLSTVVAIFSISLWLLILTGQSL